MGDFQKVSAALTTMQIDGKRSSPGSGSGTALASKDDIDQHGYAVPRDNIMNSQTGTSSSSSNRVPVMVPDAATGNEYAQPIIDQFQKSKVKQQRERREQIALQQGKQAFVKPCLFVVMV